MLQMESANKEKEEPNRVLKEHYELQWAPGPKNKFDTFLPSQMPLLER